MSRGASGHGEDSKPWTPSLRAVWSGGGGTGQGVVLIDGGVEERGGRGKADARRAGVAAWADGVGGLAGEVGRWRRRHGSQPLDSAGDGPIGRFQGLDQMLSYAIPS